MSRHKAFVQIAAAAAAATSDNEAFTDLFALDEDGIVWRWEPHIATWVRVGDRREGE